MWRIWWAPNNASKWQMGFNLAFKGLKQILTSAQFIKTTNDDNKTGKKFAKSENILHVDIQFHTDEIYECQ